MSVNKKLMKEYLQFVNKRAVETDFHAKEKLEAIEEMADLIFTARKNYWNQKSVKEKK